MFINSLHVGASLLLAAQWSIVQSSPIAVPIATIITKEDNSTAVEVLLPPADNTLSYCKGPQIYYDAEHYDCFDGSVCSKGTKGCGEQCYDPVWYKCLNNVVYGSRGDPLLKNATDVQVHFAEMMKRFEMRR